MSRAYDFVIATVITLVAFAWHRLAVEMIAPGTQLYDLALGANNLGGGQIAPFWFEIGVVWLPLIAIGTAWAWAAINEWRRQVRTSVGAARVP